MKIKILPFLLLSIIFTSYSFQLPKRIEKKVDKEIKAVFETEDYILESLDISDEINSQLQHKLTTDNLFKIIQADKVLGYAYINKAPSKTDEFDYLILLDTNLIIAKTKVLVYREDYGGEIGSKRWLQQFIGKKSSDTLQYQKDIIAISGATISASSMTNAVNIFLQDLIILHKNNVL